MRIVCPVDLDTAVLRSEISNIYGPELVGAARNRPQCATVMTVEGVE